MATGQILRGRSNMPLFGKNGTLLYSTVVSMQVDITISWGGGRDVDICGCYNTVPGEVGWNHADEIDQDGFFAHWDGDNTTGGPEYVHLKYSGGRASLLGVCFDVHTNWYRVGGEEGEDQGDGGSCTVTATDSKGTTKSHTFTPAQSHGRAASAGDPGVRINFNINGTIKSITPC